MNSSHYHIHSDRILINENFNIQFILCKICKNVLWEPEKCIDCQIHFCKFCILFHLLKSKKCPNCLLEYSSKSPDTFLLEDLNDIGVKCIYSYNGCNKILKYESIRNHENLCIYKELSCEECGHTILKKNYYSHIILCKNTYPKDIKIDYSQIIIYFQGILQKIENDNCVQLESIKMNFNEMYAQKEKNLQNLILTMEKQRKILEEFGIEKEKCKYHNEEFTKIFNFCNGNISNQVINKSRNENINKIQ